MTKNNIAHGMCYTFFTMLGQCILFGIVFIIYLASIPWQPILWVFIVGYGIIPILVSIVCCFIINRKKFRFNSKNMVSKVSIYRLASRIFAIACFMTLGYFMNTVRFNSYGQVIISLLYNFAIYVIVSACAIVFGIVEYLFVATDDV